MKNWQIILILVIIILIVAFWKQIKAFFTTASTPAEGTACSSVSTQGVSFIGTIKGGVCTPVVSLPVDTLNDRVVIYENQNPNQPFLYRMINGRIVKVIQG